MIGCLVAGKIAEKFGRKAGLMASALIFCISSAGMAFSPVLGSVYSDAFSCRNRVGMASILSPMYIAEISPA